MIIAEHWMELLGVMGISFALATLDLIALFALHLMKQVRYRYFRLLGMSKPRARALAFRHQMVIVK